MTQQLIHVVWNNGLWLIQLEKSISEIYNLYRQVVPPVFECWTLTAYFSFQYNFSVNRIKSRWLRIPFKEQHPKFKGTERINAESEFCEATQDLHWSLPFVTSNVLRAIPGMLDDPDFIAIMELLEAECEKLKEKVDHREQNMFLLMLFCAKRYLILLSQKMKVLQYWLLLYG